MAQLGFIFLPLLTAVPGLAPTPSQLVELVQLGLGHLKDTTD